MRKRFEIIAPGSFWLALVCILCACGFVVWAKCFYVAPAVREPELVGKSYSLREFPVIVISAKDGDTFAVSMDLGFDLTVKQDLRIHRVDAPESSTEAGKLVTAVAKKWILDRECFVRFRKADKYGGRFDGDLVGDGDDYAEYLLEKKLAREYAGAKRPAWSSAELQAIVERAKRELE